MCQTTELLIWHEIGQTQQWGRGGEPDPGPVVCDHLVDDGGDATEQWGEETQFNRWEWDHVIAIRKISMDIITSHLCPNINST